MEGIRVKVLLNGDVVEDGVWAGIHCTGDAKQYVLSIHPGFELGFGPYEGSPSTLEPAPVPPRAPNISFNKDSSADSITVVQADPGMTWGEFDLSGSCETPRFDADMPISAGDVLHCHNSSGTLTVTHFPTNSIIYSTTFT